MTIVQPTVSVPLRAGLAVADFINRQASETERQVGFGWVGTPHAPSTYQQLRGAYFESVATGKPLPISSEFCDSTIYRTRTDNMKFRYWHDCSHVRLGLSFNLEDELEVALWHLAQLEGAGYGKDSDPYRLLEADLVGQVLLMALIGRFPLDQQAFAASCEQRGLLRGLLSEIRVVP